MILKIYFLYIDNIVIVLCKISINLLSIGCFVVGYVVVLEDIGKIGDIYGEKVDGIVGSGSDSVNEGICCEVK